MTNVERHDIALGGVTSKVLVSYLKALGILRVVSESAGGDPGASAYWDRTGSYRIVSTLDGPALVRLFLENYRPTPIVTPWNGGSGFFPKDQKAGIEAISASSDDRFEPYRRTIESAKKLLSTSGGSEKPKEGKAQLLRQCRSVLPDEALPWLDAVFAAGDDAPRFPALLGTGGNDGRLDFANNFMQRLAELFLSKGRDEVRIERRLRAALFGENATRLFDSASIGQFGPALSGGTNMTTGISGPSRVNPWDFVLALEGATLFAGAAVRRYEAATSSGSFPFHVRASSAGYGTAADGEAEAARSELWLPLWPLPAPLGSLRILFAEGRLELNGRRARTGVEAVRAIAALGVDRGVSHFERIGLLRRNGLAYFATWLGTFHVNRVGAMDLLRELDDHMARARSCEVAAVRAATRRIDDAFVEMARGNATLTDVVGRLGRLERALARSPKARDHMRRPQQTLSAEWWSVLEEDLSSWPPELRLAAAFASWGIRGDLHHVMSFGKHVRWAEGSPDIAPSNALDLISRLALERCRRSEVSDRAVPLGGVSRVAGSDLTLLASGAIDQEAFLDFLYGLALLPGQKPIEPAEAAGLELRPIPHLVALLRATTSPTWLAEQGQTPDHPAPKIIPRLAAAVLAGKIREAAALAQQRLTASGVAAVARMSPKGLIDTRGLAAALFVPLHPKFERRLIARNLMIQQPSN